MKGMIILGVLLCWGLTGVGPVQASSFTLDSTTDEVDSLPGDGLCASSSGVCTLRAAIMETNVLTGADDVTVPVGVYRLTLTGTGEDAAATGDLDITDELTLLGESHVGHASCTGPIIDATAVGERVLHVFASVTMDHLLVTGGAESTGAWQMGGGIFFEGSAGKTITASLNRLRIIRNSADNGGGLAVLTRSGLGQADITITESIIAENTAATGLGGGIDMYADAGTRITVLDSSIMENSATFGGGLLEAGGAYTIVNSTISGNTASYGGGVSFYSAYGTGDTSYILSSTITSNQASVESGGVEIGYTDSRYVTIGNSIIASNSDGYDNEDINGSSAGSSTLTSQGYNLIGVADAGFSYYNATTGDQYGLSSAPLDAMITTLGIGHGGPTPTHVPLVGSPVIDAGPPAGCTDASGALLTTDQRGFSRHIGTACDIGAVEFRKTP